MEQKGTERKEGKYLIEKLCLETPFEAEVDVNSFPSSLISTWRDLLPALKLKAQFESLLFVVIWQRTKHDMSGFSSEVEDEREQLTQRFMTLGQKLADELKKGDFFVDYIDPSSGQPFLGQHVNTVFSETDDSIQIFGYDILELGCCRVVSHLSLIHI
eukprot:TRINITY_DN9616_c0_g1_i2.p1 TRINITY_DN9616_c0_g1~~TRINITY_DN9616_c0_g1_i2.p1  ORF type:complete len:171 (-),score=26.02 TRINITY_DN9616_c0_g1_i2:25-498(-)